jgi:hypothetical protein
VKFKFSEAGVSPEAVFTGREASYTDFISEDMGRLLLRSTPHSLHLFHESFRTRHTPFGIRIFIVD